MIFLCMKLDEEDGLKKINNPLNFKGLFIFFKPWVLFILK